MNTDISNTSSTLTETIEHYIAVLQELLSSEPRDAEAFDVWISRFSAVAASIDETCQRAYVKYSQDLTDEEALKLHHQIDEAYDRSFEPLMCSLVQKAMVYLREYGQGRPDYQRLALKGKRDTALPNPLLCDLQNEERALLAQYDKLTSSLRLQVEGREFGFQEARLELYGEDEAVRAEARGQFASWLEANDSQIQSIFSHLVKVRHEIALASGYENFVHYFWSRQYRTYSPEEALSLGHTIETSVVPLARVLNASSRVSRLPLPELQESKDFLKVARTLASRISPKVALHLDEIIQGNSLDIEARPTKWPGTAYQAAFHSSKQNFIFVNGSETFQTLTFFLHELGHAWHSSLSFREPLFFLRRAPRELEELVAISFEFLATGFVGIPLPPEVITSLHMEKLAQAFTTLSSVALKNAFEIWAYTNQSHTQQERESVWNDLSKSFRESSAQSWRIDNAMFHGPFFPTEYAIAQLGAIELTAKFLSDPVTTMERLEEVLSAGGARPFDESFSELGLDAFPSAERIRTSLNTVAERFGIPLPAIRSGIAE